MSNATKLSEEDFIYHASVIATLSKAIAIRDHWFEYISNKYELLDGEAVDPKGAIVIISNPNLSR
jgi:hypothetical protein